MKLFQIIDKDWDIILKWDFEYLKNERKKAINQWFIKKNDWSIENISE